MVLFLFVIIYFIYMHYVEKTLKQRLCMYFCIVVLLGCFQALLGQEYHFHLHHSFLGFVLYLGVGLKKPNLISLAFASFLVGMVINGIMNWGWNGSLYDYVPGTGGGGHGGGGGGGSSSGSSGHHVVRLPQLINTSLTPNSVNIVWPNNYTFAKNVQLYMNDILIYQDIVRPGKNNFLVKGLIYETVYVRYFFQVEWTPFNIR